MLQKISSVFVVYRCKSLTGSPDPTHAIGMDKPCNVEVGFDRWGCSFPVDHSNSFDLLQEVSEIKCRVYSNSVFFIITQI